MVAFGDRWKICLPRALRPSNESMEKECFLLMTLSVRRGKCQKKNRKYALTSKFLQIPFRILSFREAQVYVCRQPDNTPFLWVRFAEGLRLGDGCAHHVEWGKNSNNKSCSSNTTASTMIKPFIYIKV